MGLGKQCGRGRVRD